MEHALDYVNDRRGYRCIILNVFHIYASERARLRSAARPRSVAHMCYAQYPATIRLLLSLRPADRAVVEHLTCRRRRRRRRRHRDQL